MSPFSCSSAELDSTDVSPRLQTPFGAIHVAAEVGGVTATDSPPDLVYRLARGGWLFHWQLEEALAELLLCRPLYELPDGMSVADCWAGMWRARALRPLASCVFSSEWVSGAGSPNGGPAGGQGLDALAWDDGHRIISMGTEDGEWLARRAHRGQNLPSHWAAQLDRFDFVEHTEGGLRIPFPALQPDELCQAHFVIAWAPLADEGADTWYAVDRLPEHILAGEGCV